MAQIVVGFSRPSGWFEPFSWLIRLAYWSPFSHAYIRYSSTDLGVDLIVQASGLEINLIEQSIFDSEEVIYKEFTLPISDENKSAMVKFAFAQLGKPYNVLGIFGMAWVRIGQLLGLNLKSPFQYNGSSAFCSQFVAYILENYDNIDFGNVANIAPSDIYAVLSKINA